MEYIKYLLIFEKKYFKNKIFKKEIINNDKYKKSLKIITVMCDKYDILDETKYYIYTLYKLYINNNDTDDKKKIIIITIACLLIGTKYYEVSYFTIDFLIDHFKTDINSNDIKFEEIKILKYFDFNLNIPTIYTFLSNYINIYDNINNTEIFNTLLKKSLKNYDNIISNELFVDELPSTISLLLMYNNLKSDTFITYILDNIKDNISKKININYLNDLLNKINNII